MEKASQTAKEHIRDRIMAARGQKTCDIVFKNAQFLDVFTGQFQKGDVAVFDGIIVGISESYHGQKEIDLEGAFIVPGFIDSHVHIESSLMTPDRFEDAVLPCGTTTVFWDPHEIANVKGLSGIQWALDATQDLSLDVYVLVPSCVPSTNPAFELETSGFELKAHDLKAFSHHSRVLGLAEMMNFPGLLHGEEDVMAKLANFSHLKRDGHCPGLRGRDLNAYATAGIHSCHESTTAAEAKEKLTKGIHVLVREGSCAKDADELLGLISTYSAPEIGLCSDDRNPLDIADEGHIHFIVQKALARGIRPEDIFRTASYSAARMFGLHDRGAIAPGYLADLVVIKRHNSDWTKGFHIIDVYKKGQAIGDRLRTKAPPFPASWQGSNIQVKSIEAQHLVIPAPEGAQTCQVNVIGVIPQQILTEKKNLEIRPQRGELHSDIKRDLLKIAVFERHHKTGHHTVAFVQGFGMKEGAIATSINHDSHNLIAVGSSDDAILKALKELVHIDGGIVVVDHAGQCHSLKLPIAGLMTSEPPEAVATKLRELKAIVKATGCGLKEPFLQLSFLALPVIPSLKITDRGLVDVEQFKKISIISD